jgi:dipeptidyl-peptidase-3
MTPVYGSDGEITDVLLDFSESYTEQMLRYSRDYSVEDWII